MKRWLSVFLVILLLGALAVPVQAQTPLAPPANPLVDVVGTKYERAVGYLYSLGVVTGIDARTYGPSEQVTRAQMAAFVMRSIGQQNAPVTSNISFKDVPADHWALGVIARAAQAGIVKGTPEGFFNPGAPVTYAEAVTMVLRALGYERTLTGTYPLAQVLKAQELGWLANVDFGMDKPATRGDLALILTAAIFETPHADTGLTLSQSVHKRAVSLGLEPAASYVLAGDTQMSLAGMDWFGKSFSLTAESFAIRGSGASISKSGLLTVGTAADQVVVEARYGGQTAERTFDVIKSISIKGADSAVKVGESLKLQAEGVTTSGRKVALEPVWSIKSGSGSITKDGVLTPTGAGTIVVEAQAGSLRAQANVSSASSIAISPAELTLAIGQSQQLKAEVLDGSGKTVNVPVTWKVIQGSATVSADGLLTAGNSGPIKVEAAAGGMTATVTVQLINRLTIDQTSPNLARNSTMTFTATAHTLDGKSMPVSPTWSATGGIGIIGTTGTLLGTAAGVGTVQASYYGLKASVNVTVAGEPAAIRVEADRLSLSANGKTPVTVTASLVDGRGALTTGNVETITFSLSSNSLGTLSAYSAKVENGKAKVTFTPSEQAGTIVIIASAPGTQLASGSTQVTTVVPAVAAVRLSAAPATLAADSYSRTQITATLEDSYGAPIKNQTGSPITVSLSTSSGAAGTLEAQILQIPLAATSATTTFRASGVVGSSTIRGTSTYAVIPVSVQTVTVGAAAKLAIRPITETVLADGSKEMLVVVELQDAAGYVRTADSGLTIQLSGTNGTDPLAARTSNTVNGVATFRVTATKAGTYTLKATAYNSAIAMGETTGTFVAGQAHHLELVAQPGTQISADGVSKIQLVAKVLDRYNNVVKDASTKIKFSKNQNQGATNMVNDTEVMPVEGLATLEITATVVPGTDSFVVSTQGLQASAPLQITSRITGGAYKLQIDPIVPSSVAAGQTFTVQVRILDSLNNLVTGATGRTVTLVSNSPTAVISGAQVSQAGLATFTVTDTKVGTPVFTASSSGLVSDAAGRSVTVVAGPVSTVRLEASPEGLASDGRSSTTISARAVDAYGNPALWSTAVQLQIDNTTSGRLSSSYLYSGSQVLLYSTSVPGTITVTGTASGVSVAPLSIRTYIPAAPARVVVEPVEPFLVSGAYVRPTALKVKVLDVNGNLATGVSTGSNLSAAGLTITGSGGTNTTRITAGSNSGLPGFAPNGITTGAVNIVNGVGTLQFTNSRAESVFVTPVVYYNGQPLTGDGTTVTTLPGPGTQIIVTPDNLVLSAQAAIPLTVQAYVADEFGNVVTAADDTFQFTPSVTTHLTFPAETTVPTVNGKASLTVTSKTSATGGATLLTVKSIKTGLTRSVVISTDLPPAKATLSATNISGTSNVVSASEGAVKIQVNALQRQSAQNILVYVNGRLVAAYTATDLAVQSAGLGPSETSWTGYVRVTDFAPGTNSVTVILTNGLGLSPVSDQATVIVQ